VGKLSEKIMAKPKFIISTTGTSIGTNVRKNIFGQCFREGTTDRISSEIKKSLEGKDIDSISAETKSLHKIGIDSSTKIAFIHTDTEDGKLCAEILRDWCKEQWGCSVYIYGVKGLQIKDAGLFAREGLKNYLRLCIDLIEKYSLNHEVILNPTGGFKGIVPYTTLIGMLFSKSIYYIFERSDALIKLPAIPINYDEEILDRCAEKLKRIDNETAITYDEFWRGIDYYEKERFMPLIEEEGKAVSLSPIGILLWERYKKDFPPYLHRSEKRPEDKRIILRDDHGKDILMHWARRLINIPYIEEVVNSLPFNPAATKPIKRITEDGLIELVLTKTDAGYGMVVKTTGRDEKETHEIANILIARYAL